MLSLFLNGSHQNLGTQGLVAIAVVGMCCLPVASAAAGDIQIIAKGSDALSWQAFDIDEDEDEEAQRSHYTMTTRDQNRGRAGHDTALFMNAHGICRKIDNAAGEINPLFMGVKSEEEWRSVHGVDEGGDVNGGYTYYANRHDIPVQMTVCCAPVTVLICGEEKPITFKALGETVTIAGGYSREADIRCMGNNDYKAIDGRGFCQPPKEHENPDAVGDNKRPPVESIWNSYDGSSRANHPEYRRGPEER